MKKARINGRSEIQELQTAEGRWVLVRDANLLTAVAEGAAG